MSTDIQQRLLAHLESMSRILRESLSGAEPPQAPTPSGAAVFDAVRQATGFSEKHLTGRCRDREVIDARWIACVLFDDLGMSHSEIGRILKKHHASVLHALRRSKDLAEVDPQFRSQLCRAREWMRGKIERGMA